MENRVIHCSTRMSEDHDAVKTALTLDLSQVTTEDLIEYAIDAIVIKWQGMVRRSKSITVVPTEATYVVPKPGTRATGEVSAYQALVKVLGAEGAARLVAKHDGDATKALAAVKAAMGE